MTTFASICQFGDVALLDALLLEALLELALDLSKAGAFSGRVRRRA